MTEGKDLSKGTVSGCGCIEKHNARRGRIPEDLTGKTFGYLTVIRRIENRHGRTCWLCRCICGGEKAATAHDLKAGKVKSCGCKTHEHGHNRINLTGKLFGRLTAMYPTERRDQKGAVYWHCRCDCGNETEVSASRLMYGNYRSCGCLKAENQKNIYEKLHLVDGTCVEMLEKRKHRSDNTSGFRGVFKMKNGRYRVHIGFRRQRFYLGTVDSFDKAVQIRLAAEHLLHDGFVEAWHAWKEKADKDPEWGKQHPLKFEVDREQLRECRNEAE